MATYPETAAAIVAVEMLEFIDIMHASRMPTSLYSLRRLMDDKVFSSRGSAQRTAILLLAAQCLLTVAAGDTSHGGKDWPSE